MYLFMTGYPGFIASRLIKELVRRQQFSEIYLLVLRTPDRQFLKFAEQFIASDLSDLPITLVEGDISEHHLGIRDQTILNKMQTTRGEWWHLAAIYRLDVGEQVAWKMNVEGTRQVLALAGMCRELSRLHYVSTAYVSGNRLGEVKEEELKDKTKQGFKNFYESTKHEAERLVRLEMARLPITIYRYGVVVGDSQTGETAKFDGPYFMMQFFKRWGCIPLPRVGPMTYSFNIVPVDFVVRASAAIAARADTVGRTFHITDPNPVSSGELYTRMAGLLGKPKPRGCIPKRMMDWVSRPRMVQRLLGFPHEAVVYMNHGADYDCSQTMAALKSEGITCPRVEDYLPKLVSWYHQHADRADLRIVL